jgi:hypothetical protein
VRLDAPSPLVLGEFDVPDVLVLAVPRFHQLSASALRRARVRVPTPRTGSVQFMIEREARTRAISCMTAAMGSNLSSSPCTLRSEPFLIAPAPSYMAERLWLSPRWMSEGVGGSTGRGRLV